MVAPFGRELWDGHVLAGLEAARDVAALRRRASEDARNNIIGCRGLICRAFLGQHFCWVLGR
jgi:hypothetical protein